MHKISAYTLPAALRGLPSTLRGLRLRLARGIGADERGIAAVEFALILPLMLVIYLGLVEVSRGMRAAQRLDLVSHTLADLTAQMLPGQSTQLTADCLSTGATPGACISETDINQIFASATTLMAPLPTTNMQMTISEVMISGLPNNTSPTSWRARTMWTVTRNGATARPCGVDLTAGDLPPVSTTTMPTGYLVPSGGVNPAVGALIVVDVIYNYSPGVHFEMFKWSSPPTWTMRRTSYATARNTQIQTQGTGHIHYYMTSGTNCNGTP